MQQIKNISVYCSSSDAIPQVYMDAAAKLGALLGKHGINIINGGGSIGLMRVITDTVMANGGKATGVIPHFMVEKGWCHPSMSRLITVETMHERKKLMADMSDAAIAMPGGYGTLEELLEIITWRQLGLYSKPVIILNTDNYFEDLISMLDRAQREGFMRDSTISLMEIAATPEEIIQKLTS